MMIFSPRVNLYKLGGQVQREVHIHQVGFAGNAEDWQVELPMQFERGVLILLLVTLGCARNVGGPWSHIFVSSSASPWVTLDLCSLKFKMIFMQDESYSC